MCLQDIVGSVKVAVEEPLPEQKVELDYDDEQQQPDSKRIVLQVKECAISAGHLFVIIVSSLITTLMIR